MKFRLVQIRTSNARAYGGGQLLDLPYEPDAFPSCGQLTLGHGHTFKWNDVRECGERCVQVSNGPVSLRLVACA